MKLTFLPKNVTCEGKEGYNLLRMAGEAGIEIDGNCAGDGTCGKCKVRILKGNNFCFTHSEELRLTELEKTAGYRLACCFVPNEETVVEVPLAEGAAKRKTTLVQMPKDFDLDSPIRTQTVELPTATIEDQAADAERLLTLCHADNISFQAVEKLPHLLQKGRKITAIMRNGAIVDVGGDDCTCYGLAVDIGTTTAVGMLWNIVSGEFQGAIALTNPQGTYGADVISRIMFAEKSDENLNMIHNKILFCINEMVEQFAQKNEMKSEQIYEISVVGNTTMSHLFLGVNPAQLARAPFAPVFCRKICGRAKDLGITSNPLADFYLLPNIAGHVGSDITGGIIFAEFMESGKKTILLDVGTNGEIVASANGKAIACSTAAGPAFEGASIYQGMRAAEGAIERVDIKDDVELKVIGNAEPAGICGSGIIDAVAEMLEAGIIDKSGRLVTPEKLQEKGAADAIVQRLRTNEKNREFVLAYGNGRGDVVITQQDIREVQLAKAAIFAGMRIMMNDLGISEEDLDQVLIAGAFGNYIRQESALKIGLLPQISKAKIHSIGNAAGIGACMALLSEKKRAEADSVAEKIIHLELSACSEFQDEYIKQMKFKK